jgi:hypothetical protein
VIVATAPVASATAPAGTTPVKDAPAKVILKGGVSQTISPLIEGEQHEVPAGVPVNLTLLVNLNSELTKVGDKVVAMVSADSKNEGKVVLPGQWFVCGKVTEVAGQRRLGRDGYISIHFERLVSPDNKYDLPIDVTASTRDSTAKAVAKIVAKDTGYVAVGAAAGALTSVQLTGIPVAIATHGYSVAIGGGVGATIGLIGALKRKGKITTAIHGENLKFKLDKPVTLPAFNEKAIPSAAPLAKIENLDISIEKFDFRRDPFGDKRSQLLQVNFKFDNKTDREYSFGNIAVVSDHNQMYYPYVLDNLKQRQKRVAPKSREVGSITFSVNSGKHKYWLVLLDRGNRSELARVPVN